MLPNENDFVIGNYDNDLQPRNVQSASNDAKPLVSGSLPDVEQIEMHIRTHNPYPLGKQNNVDWSNGFERGVAWIIGMLSGNDH